MINSRKIDDLAPEVQTICRNHITLCEIEGIELLITSTYRDAESQDDLYAIGRTKELTRKPVTKAKGWQSWHQYLCAWDVVPVVGGKCVWNSRDPLWAQVIRIGEKVGAAHPMAWDLPHFQVTPQGLTIAQAKVRFSEKGTIFA